MPTWLIDVIGYGFLIGWWIFLVAFTITAWREYK